MTEKYNIIITPDAEADLIGIRNYIMYSLEEPETAIKYIRKIKKEILQLSYMADSIKIEDDEPLCSMGIRKLITENYYTYYEINEKTNEVFVLNVIYKGRDQLKALNLK